MTTENLATFHSDPAKKTQWSAFLKRVRPHSSIAPPSLAEVIPFLEQFLMPAARGGEGPEGDWPAGGPWKVKRVRVSDSAG